MQTEVLSTLVRIHHQQIHPVASLYVLRQCELEDSDHHFLFEHRRQLGSVDFLRWLMRSSPGKTRLAVMGIAQFADRNPQKFIHEIACAPTFSLDECELREFKSHCTLHTDIQAKSKPNGPSAQPYFDVSSLIDVGTFSDVVAHLDNNHAFCEQGTEALFQCIESSENPDEIASLLSELERRQTPLYQRLQLASKSIAQRKISTGLVYWLARTLHSRTAWEKFGSSVLRSFLRQNLYSSILDLFPWSWTDHVDESAQSLKNLLPEVMCAVFTQALLDECEQALSAHQMELVEAYLAAALCVGAPSRVASRMHALLSRLKGQPTSYLLLQTAYERTRRHRRSPDHPLTDIVAATHALTDILSP